MNILHFVPADAAARKENPTALLTLKLERGASSNKAIEHAAAQGWLPWKKLPKSERRAYEPLIRNRMANTARMGR